LLDTDALAIAGLVGSTDATAGKHVAIAKAVTTILNRFTLSPYRVGDTLNEYTVSKINPKNVVITDGRQQKILRMYAYEIKK
jgi:MSHA biogenesis protein MshK